MATSVTASAATSQDFPASVTQQRILNIQNYINNVVNDVVQANTNQLAADYSSTGRSLALLAKDLLPGKGCPLSPSHPAQNKNQAIAYLQKVQMILSELSLDVVAKDLTKGQTDICRATAQYGDVANYVQEVGTDGQIATGVE